MEKIAVLIPCYNEEKTIEKVIKDFRKELPDAKIYVYNNNSKDKTKDIAIMNNAIVVDEYKQGKGNVVKSQFRDIDADIYVMVDGDNTYPAEFVHQLIKQHDFFLIQDYIFFLKQVYNNFHHLMKKFPNHNSINLYQF